jgi:hypothetical protein
VYITFLFDEKIECNSVSLVNTTKMEELKTVNNQDDQLSEALEALNLDKVSDVTIEEPKNTIEIFKKWINTIENKSIILLRDEEVIQWLFNDTSFLPEIEKKNKTNDIKQYKIAEDKWGQAKMKACRPDLGLHKQWTNLFGEYIVKELYILQNKTVTKPVKKMNHDPDWEVDDAILEVKTQTYFTSGTAGEKILGTPLKYAEIPDLYSKPLKIICVGGAEKVCREEYGNLPGNKCTSQKKKILDFIRDCQIEYIGATDILKLLSSK